jgi:hypothetical protein
LVVAVRKTPQPAAACIKRTQLSNIFLQPRWLVDHQLFQWRFDEVERISIVEGDRRLELARTGDGFSMTAPERAQVESEIVEKRFADLLELRGRLVDAPVTPETFGAVKHTVTLTRTGTESEPLTETLQLGVRRDDGTVLVRRDVDGVVLRFAADDLRGFAADALLLKKRRLIELEARQVAKLLVDNRGTRWVLTQPTPASFQLLEPPGLIADSTLAVEWVEAVRQLKALRWVAASDDGSFGLGKPWLRFELEGTQGERLGVSVGGRGPRGYFARRDAEPGVFLISRSVVDTLTTLVLDRSGFSLDPDTVKTVRVSVPSRVIELERLGRDFVPTSSSALAPSDVRALIDALSLVRAEAAVSYDRIDERDFREPLLDVQMTFERDGEVVQRHWQVSVGDTYRGVSVYLARQVGGRAIYAIPRQQITRVLDVL